MMHMRLWFHVLTYIYVDDLLTYSNGPLIKSLFLVQVSQAEVKNFFERACGEVRMLPQTTQFQS